MSIDALGGCLCGSLRYRFRGKPLAFYQCHCSDCQRQTGSAFGLSMIARREDVSVLDGEPAGFRISMLDGRVKCGRFCAKCAARVWGEPVKLPQLVVLRLGTFDAPPAFPPCGDIWTASARPWVSFTDGPRFEGQPEDPLALVRAWNAGPGPAAGAPR